MGIQSTYGGTPKKWSNGFPTREPDPFDIKGVTLVEKAQLGVALVYAGTGPDRSTVRKPQQNSAVITVSADFIASNSTVGNITVTTLAGVATTTTLSATVYATSHAVTIAAIATKIAAISGILSATASGDTITVVASGDNAVTAASFVTTLGSSQPTFTYTAGSVDKVAGFLMRKDDEPHSDGIYFDAGTQVKMLCKGGLACLSEETLTPASTLYTRFADGGAGGDYRGILRASAGTSPAVAMAVTGDGRFTVEEGAAAGSESNIEFSVLP